MADGETGIPIPKQCQVSRMAIYGFSNSSFSKFVKKMTSYGVFLVTFSIVAVTFLPPIDYP
jgi:hypothetical protein